jgi:hypothetical protein
MSPPCNNPNVAATTNFVSTEEPLKSLLGEAENGRIQLPEFQREVLCEDEWIKCLLASVSLGYPIGALMLLQTGNSDMRFKAEPIAGAPPSTTAPGQLLIDGQQRITALYQALASGKVVQTQDAQQNPLQRWYYIDIRAALDPDADRDGAIISVPENRRVRTLHDLKLDISTAELEWKQGLFPLRMIFGGRGELRRWQRGFASHAAPEDTGAYVDLTDRFAAEVLSAFEGYLVPTITLGKETARWSLRVHGGPEGRSLSDRYRIIDRDFRRS